MAGGQAAWTSGYLAGESVATKNNISLIEKVLNDNRTFFYFNFLMMYKQWVEFNRKVLNGDKPFTAANLKISS